MSNSKPVPIPSDAALDAAFTMQVGAGDNLFRVSVELHLERGVLVLFGPSGAGKTLTLKTLVGAARPSQGYLRVKGRTLFDLDEDVFVASHRRRIGYVPQHNSLFPFCNVSQNVVFGLPREQRKRNSERVEQLIVELGLEHLREAMPEKLSGGERQRVALARALAVSPELLVLDEPFGAIDQDGRHELRATLAKVLRQHHTPAIFVTHDPLEALDLGDHMVKLKRGRVIASGPPASLLPASQGFHLSGRKVEVSDGLDAGRSKLVLSDAQLHGPTELLQAAEAQLELDLRLNEGMRSRDADQEPTDRAGE